MEILKLINSNKQKFVVLAGSLWCISMLIVKFDYRFKYRWLVFFLWLISLGLFVVYFVLNEGKFVNNIKANKIFDSNFILIIILALFTRFIFLRIYPFNSIGDEMRDGGWDALRIVTGEIRNIFSYGRYEAHGLIIPTFSSLFYLIFGNSTITFKFASALISFVDILFLYKFVEIFFNRKYAFFSAFVLICLPLHLYYGRTEIVVVFSSILTTINIFFIIWYIKERKAEIMRLIFLFSGFCLNFHASIKPVIFALIFILFLLLIVRLKQIDIKSIKRILLEITICIILFIVGFGPRLLFTTPNVLFHTKSVSLINKTDKYYRTFNDENYQISTKISTAFSNYQKSLLGYVKEPVSYHYTHKNPLLIFPLNIFFIIGAVFMLIKGKLPHKVILFLAMLLPFTNSAITNCVNCDHRLAVLFPILSMITGIGFIELTNYINKAKINYKIFKILGNTIIYSLFFITNIFNLFDFFYNERASESMFWYQRESITQDYLLSYMIRTIKNNENLKEEEDLSIFLSKSNYDYFNLFHINEAIEFQIPNKNISLIIDETYSINEIHVSSHKNSQTETNLYTYCEKYKRFICPPNKEKLIIKTS
ncbi:hypothetical protein GF362_00595 [Candidatus Dojkabacteria bacterium]|nr:hypothetical protein [Candidatus Dojkabacteria bacterium]